MDLEKVFMCGGAQAGHVTERGIGKDQVGSDLVAIGNVAAQTAQRFEEIVIDTLPGFGFGAAAAGSIDSFSASIRAHGVRVCTG